VDKVLWSKKSDDWSTPKDLYNELDKEFNFTFDPCPLHSEEDGLVIAWGKSCFVNPPYSNIKGFLEKAVEELQKNTEIVVFLIPSRTDTKWFHEYIYGKAEIRFIKGRLKFGNSKNSAPFPSMICIFRK
jgi:phage N-6-adenine-methyltransferase